ncbi:hypothetical protein NE237_031668 [Protea cynaroides]|uniref:X8 domain-containing protein n=1 Tax=Protea cynaroides TaxID=273540 RepID=A0A9Q0L205_9MAGN|nr:hypothetical protein NE237_031668 [Protea cynaroides]
MGTRVHQCLIFFLLGIFLCAGSSVIETTLVGATRHTQELDHKKLAISTSVSYIERDVITPLATVPVVNPTPTTTPTPITPVINPITPPEAPMTNPVTPPAAPVTDTPPTAPGMNPDTPPAVPTIPTPTTTPTGTPEAPTITTPGTTPTGTPAAPTIPTPSTTTPSGTPASSGGSWCVASQSASQTALQVALDYACGYGGADCSAIQLGGPCYNPDTLHDHASYAFNSYYQKNPISTSCNFGGTAVLTNTDPSSGSCTYPSSSTGSTGSTSANPTGSTVLNTTNPTGPTVYGSEPTGSTTNSAASVSHSLLMVFTMACLLVAALPVRWM